MIRDDAPVPDVLAAVEACGGLLVAAPRASAPETRAWHLGSCDVSGFAALGVAEVVLHTYDIAQGLEVDWRPPARFSTRILDRLAPDAIAQQRQRTGRLRHSTQVLVRRRIDWLHRYTSLKNVVSAVREVPYTCPCCGHATLPERGSYEICDECGWEDDGQDNHDSAVVRGGPNGRLSLDEARVRYVGEGRGRTPQPHVPPSDPV